MAKNYNQVMKSSRDQVSSDGFVPCCRSAPAYR